MNREKPATVYLSLGSNIGDRWAYFSAAINKLQEKIEDINKSSIYETKPWGKTDQPSFLNMCVSGRTTLEPDQLLRFLKSIEAESGRSHAEKWGPREIDIDILFYEDEILDKDGLKIPHPHIAERAFVLVPLAEVAPDFVHPVLKKTVSELAGSIGSSGVERLSDA